MRFICTNETAPAVISELERARVNWFLSINYDVMPEELKKTGVRTYRSLKIGGEEFEFSGGFNDLHTVSYQEILDGKGFPISETHAAIQVVHEIRNRALSPKQ